MNRRNFLRLTGALAAGSVLAACQPKTVVVEKEVTRVIKETVVVAGTPQVVEREVTKVVKEVVTVTPEPEISGELPVPRDEAFVVDDTVTFRVFDSFNYFIPNGVQPSSGYNVVNLEHLWVNAVVKTGYIFVLGTGWEYNDDFTQMTISTNPQAHWSDGEPFTSKDVKFTIEMCMSDPKLTYHADFTDFVDAVETPDDHTVVLEFKKANPRMHQILGCEIGSGFPIVPQHIWEGEDPTTFKANPPVTTSAYKLKEAIPALRMFVWERDENYWNKSRWFPNPKYAVYRTSAPLDAEQKALEANEYDYGHAQLDYQQMLAAAEANPAIRIICMRDPCPRGMWVNCAKYPLSLPEVRWAISYCLNREKFGRVVWMIPTVAAKYPFADYEAMMPYVFEDVLQEYDLTVYDPARAAKMLDDLGFMPGPDGIRVDDRGNKLSWEVMTPRPPGVREYEFAADLGYELEKIGVELNVKSYFGSRAAMWEKFGLGDYDMTAHWVCGAFLDPYLLYREFHSSRAVPVGESAPGRSQARLQDPEFDVVIDKLATVPPDAPEAKALYKEGLRLYMRNLPALPVIQTTFCEPQNNTYWTGYPTEDNLYAVPFHWWHQFLWTVFGIEKA